jgi:hypothetical protein
MRCVYVNMHTDSAVQYLRSSGNIRMKHRTGHSRLQVPAPERFFSYFENSPKREKKENYSITIAGPDDSAVTAFVYQVSSGKSGDGYVHFPVTGLSPALPKE